MKNTESDESVVCRRCGSSSGGDDAEESSAPLLVNECPHCGSIISIGGHRW